MSSHISVETRFGHGGEEGGGGGGLYPSVMMAGRVALPLLSPIYSTTADRPPEFTTNWASCGEEV